MASRKKRRRPRLNRAHDDEMNPEFQVAPMADLLFVLLVFFMSITSVEVLRTQKGIELPVAKDSLENKQKAHQIVVNVGWSANTRAGEIRSPRVPNSEPLRLECEHFIECIRENRAPLSDGESGLRVVRIFEGMQRELDASKRNAPVASGA